MVKKRSIYPYLLVAPALIIILCVVFIPVVNAIGMSFQSYDLRRPLQIGFIGLENYMDALHDDLFWKSLIKTIFWVIFGVGFQFFFGFILALLLNQSFKGRGFIRAISLIPWVTPGVLIGLMWRWMYDGNYGVINDILSKLNLIDANVPFLSSPDSAFASVIVTIIWQGIPFFALMILAGLQGIPAELYEAAKIDGANTVQIFFKITLPYMLFVMTPYLITQFTGNINNFNVIFLLSGGNPTGVGDTAGSTDLLVTWLYKLTVDKSYYNLGAVIGIMTFIVLAIVSLITYRNTASYKDEEGFM